MIYQFPNQDFILMTHYKNLYTVIASANVPPQGKRFLLFKHDQMQMGLSIVTTDTFSSHMHLTCKWWYLIFRMILYQSICTENQSGDNSFITWHLTNRQTCTNTVNMVKKLVTIFASHLDSFIVKNNHFKYLISTAISGSGQLTSQMTLLSFAGICKNCAIPGSLPGQFPG